MAPSTLNVEVITSFAELWSLGPEWRVLEARCGTDLPFQTWEWSVSWWSHLHEDRPGVRDALRVCVVRKLSGEVVGIAPLMLTERPGIGPVRIRMLQFMGADPNITELRVMLCDPAFERDCYQAVMRELASAAEQWDWIAWEGLGPEMGTLIGMGDAFVCADERSAFILGLPSTWDEFRKPLGRNMKGSLRHCYSSLKRDGLTCRLEAFAGPVEVVSALADVFRLHEARTSVKGETDVFASPRAREFLVEVCQRLATRGAARVFQLWVGEKLVATRIGFVLGSSLYLYYSGWDPDYSRYSVMTTLLAEVIQYAIAEGFERVNLSTGTDASKTRWGAREVRYTGVRQLSPRPNARVVHSVYDFAVRARTSKVARLLTPAFLTRGALAVAAPANGLRSSHFGGWAGSFRFWGVGAAVTVGVDLLNEVADWVLQLFPVWV